eukprot:Pompholyxophrys_punicea_v1_NODE_57_length_4146_cov_6.766521.p1 type:complete len:334 gc:universal NODE_57_length_4146_cov_6.766521:2851-3852(+)
MTTKEQQSQFRESDFVLRDSQTHARHCESLKKPNGQFWSKIYGVCNLSCLSRCPGFDVTKMLPHDLMHIILEGGLPYEINLFLFYCILDKKYFTVQTFNSRLQAFNCWGTDTDSRPGPLRLAQLTKRKLNKLSKQNASQSWCLARILPFLLENLVPETDEHWICLRGHISITYRCMMREYDSLDLLLLQSDIEEHHTLFCRLYPHNNITPKLHYYVHLPSQIRMYGPLRFIWCMRFEAKHKKFKRLGMISNFKNVPYTLCKRWDIETNVVWEPESDIFEKQIEGNFPRKRRHDGKHLLNWIKIHGTMFKLSSVVREKIIVNSLPQYYEHFCGE